MLLILSETETLLVWCGVTTLRTAVPAYDVLYAAWDQLLACCTPPRGEEPREIWSVQSSVLTSPAPQTDTNMGEQTQSHIELAWEATEAGCYGENKVNINNTAKRNQTRKLDKLYKIGDILGRGGFGTVYAGIRRKDGKNVAIKHIAKAKIVAMEIVSFTLLSPLLSLYM